MSAVAKFFIILGLVLVITGFVVLLFPKIHFFRLPGDIVIKRESFVFIFPITTSIIISLIVTIILHFILRR